MSEAIGRWWCRMFHRKITMPMHGEYECLRCARVFQVDY